MNKRVVIDDLLNQLHDMQLDYIDEAVNMSDLSEAKAVIAYIKAKL
jgi:hypothetical protein